MSLRLQHITFLLTGVVVPLCAISNFNYEQVKPLNFPSAKLFLGKLSAPETDIRTAIKRILCAVRVIFFRGTHKVRNNFRSIFNYLF